MYQNQNEKEKGKRLLGSWGGTIDRTINQSEIDWCASLPIEKIKIVEYSLDEIKHAVSDSNYCKVVIRCNE